jgi:hypothetical protein
LKLYFDTAYTAAEAVIPRDLFLEDVNNGVITTVPVTERLLRRVQATTRALPSSCYLRTFDALHLITAADSGFVEIWTNDRHMLAAASHLGLIGRSVQHGSH